jgi:hypothetical protein
MVDIALTNDDPDEARRHVREAMAMWTQSGFHAQHWYAMWSETLIELYVGNAAAAHERLQRDAAALRKSFLLRAQMVRGMTAYLRGCCAVASIRQESSASAQRIAEAYRMAHRLSGLTTAWAPALSTLVRAAAESAAGTRATAVASLRDALRLSEDAHLWPQAWATRYQLGRAIGGEEGRHLTEQADRMMRAQGIRAPHRSAASLAPGFWD